MGSLMDDVAQDRRSSTRQKSFLQGRVMFNNRRSSVDCIVRELSESGARLKFSTPVAVPEVFELHIPNKDETFRAHVIWNDGTDVGVALGAVEAGGTVHPPNLEDRVTKLERELAALKRRLDDAS
jgi:hypothetical protein